jgi:23S rRNA pseudouridine1911/1915/1917 synthase
MVAGEVVQAGPPAAEIPQLRPEAIPLAILFEDEHVLVVDKPRGMTVHPGHGRNRGTLVHALLAHTPTLSGTAGSHRPGIVHRLDRDTSGLMVVAKSEAAHRGLALQVRKREVSRRYLALVWGGVREDRILIDVPIGRHMRDPTRMAAVPRSQGDRRVRSALTDIRAVERLGPITLVEAQLGTGRTHQIRVHLAHVGHPVVGDPVYGRRRARQGMLGLAAETVSLVRALQGQALHAHMLRFRHPIGGQELSFSAPLPRDMGALLGHLRQRERDAATGP